MGPKFRNLKLGTEAQCDELRICLSLANRLKRVWREPGDTELVRHTVSHVQQGGGSVMF